MCRHGKKKKKIKHIQSRMHNMSAVVLHQHNYNFSIKECVYIFCSFYLKRVKKKNESLRLFDYFSAVGFCWRYEHKINTSVITYTVNLYLLSIFAQI